METIINNKLFWVFPYFSKAYDDKNFLQPFNCRIFFQLLTNILDMYFKYN